MHKDEQVRRDSAPGAKPRGTVNESHKDEMKATRDTSVDAAIPNSQQQENFAFIGEHLSLDFANTLGGHRDDNTQEYLTTYGDLVAWGQAASIVTALAAPRLLQAAQAEASLAAAVLDRAHHLREAIYHLMATHLHDQPPHTGDLAVLNAELTIALAHRHVATGSTGFVWEWDDAPTRLDAILWPIVTAAADLLTATEHAPLRECASDRCSWLFLDTTRNHSRRWCDMKGCGNQAKVRRYRQRRG